MKYLLLFVLLLFALPVELNAQRQPYVTPNPPPELMRQLEWQRVRRSLDNVANLSKRSQEQRRRETSDNREIILNAIYRHSTNSELELLAPEDEDKVKYAGFLKTDGTGLIKLIRDFGCDEYSAVEPNTQLCLRFSMPGGGSAYSFRRADYQFWKLADLLYDGKSFISFGQMSLGFLVDIGKTPLEKVGADTNGVAYVTNFTPSTKISEAAKQNSAFADGLRDNGFLYRKFLPVVVGDTYVLRSVAYKGQVPRTHYEIKYNELDLDQRADIVTAFTVVREDINGTVTLLWKRLQSKHAPVLEPDNKKTNGH